MGKLIYTTYTESEIRDLLTDILRPIIVSEIQKALSISNNSSPPNQEEYLKRKDVCKLLKISLPTLARLSKDGVLNAKIMGGSYRYSKSQLTAYMNNGKRR